MNILFTCAGRRVVLMEAFRRALTELGLEGRILAADVTAASAAYQRADVGVLVPPAQTVQYVPALLDACRGHHVGLVVPLTDLDLRTLAQHRRQFTQAGADVMIGSSQTIRLCRDKTLTMEYLQQRGLPAIRTLSLEQFRQSPFFPCFIKPIRGSASVGTALLHSEAELKAHLATFGDLMLIQDYVPGAEFTVDIYRSKAGRVECVVPRQRLVIRSGEVEKALTVDDPELIEAGMRIGQGLDDTWGVINAQCRRPPGGQAHFFEINPRFGGGVPLAIAAGADLPRYVIEDALHLPLTAKLGHFRPNVLMLRYDESIFIPDPSPDDPRRGDTPQSR